MRLIRYTPKYTASRYPTLLDEIDRLFETAFPVPSTVPRRSGPDFPVEVSETKDAYTVRAELPGFRKEDLSLELLENALTITAHQKTGTKAEGNDQPETVRERRASRTLALPDNVVLEKIAAAYENGLLTLTLPKREEPKPRRIEIGS
jgi:HSP20 family protein